MNILRIVMRTGIILAAALVVIGLAFGLSKTSYATSVFGSSGGERPQMSDTTTTTDTFGTSTTTTTTRTRPTGEGGERGGGGIGGAAAMLKPLIEIGVIVLVVAPVYHFLQRWLARRKRKPVAEPAA